MTITRPPSGYGGYGGYDDMVVQICGWVQRGVACVKHADHLDDHDFRLTGSILNVVEYGMQYGVPYLVLDNGSVYYQFPPKFVSKEGEKEMSMNLAIEQLEDIVDAVKKVEASGLDITQIRVAGHEIWLRSTNDEKEGRTYRIIGISDRHAGVAPVMRKGALT